MGRQVGTGGFPAIDDPAGDAGMDGVQEQFRDDTPSVARVLAAFDRQGDNMAFVINHANLYRLTEKFDRELEEDRTTIRAFRAAAES